ncbi:MAG: PhzF family phenazine biosynthesis protein [Planctomycetota bacterium]
MCGSSKSQLWQIDAFADAAFGGNPAAVCLLPAFPDDSWMQRLAAEMNLSETAFLVPTDNRCRFHLRWFTPVNEVDLCGHATLASMQALREANLINRDQEVHFQTRSGELRCHENDGWISIDLPAIELGKSLSNEARVEVNAALGVDAIEAHRSTIDWVAVLPEESMVCHLTPDLERIKKLPTRGLMVTAASTQGPHDFVSRFFSPQYGIDEDPVTGSAHCCLAPYWAGRLGRDTLVGLQASPRSGQVRCQVRGDRVALTGKAVTVFSGNLCVQPAVT